MRRRFLVTYDIADPGRLRRVFRAMHGFGNAVQYSVFLCDMSPVERQLLRERLTALLHQREDRVLIVDLGAVEASRAPVFEVMGRQLESMPEAFRAVII